MAIDDDMVGRTIGTSTLKAGCYAKTITLKQAKPEPEIYAYRTLKSSVTVIENNAYLFEPETKELDFDSRSLTRQHLRCAYPLHYHLERESAQKRPAWSPPKKNHSLLTAMRSCAPLPSRGFRTALTRRDVPLPVVGFTSK